MLWEIELRPRKPEFDREARDVAERAARFGIELPEISSSRSYLVEADGEIDTAGVAARLADEIVEDAAVRPLPQGGDDPNAISVLLKPGVTDNTGQTAAGMLRRAGIDVSAVGVCRRYRFASDLGDDVRDRLVRRVLANDAIERAVVGPLKLTSISVGGSYDFELKTTPILAADDDELMRVSREGLLSLSLDEMRTIWAHFKKLGREPTDCELETLAQTWSEHCSHKTLAGRIRYTEKNADGTERVVEFENMLKETIFAATVAIREKLGDDDWCVSVFKDNAGIVTFDEKHHVCFKVETHNRPSALEPYGGANTGIGGVIRDTLGTGLGARPVCNTDVFCFADPNTPVEDLPKGVLHPRTVMNGVVAGVRDYGNRMGIPTVNGAVLFDERYLGNPLVFCGNVGLIPVGKCEKKVSPGDRIVAIGGRTGKDGIHGATFSSAGLDADSETTSGGAVQIGDAVTEQMVTEVLIRARDRDLYTAVTDCGAGGFSSAVGEMGEETGADVELSLAPLKYDGLSYTEIWISEAQERMVFAVPPGHVEEFKKLCESEGVEATDLGVFTDTGRLILKYHGETVCDLSMAFMHDGRPPVVREATWEPPAIDLKSRIVPEGSRDDELLRDPNKMLLAILGDLDVCSKESIVRQYDHEVQGGSVVKPFVGVNEDGPSDAAVVRPDLTSNRGLVISNGIATRLGDWDPAAMAACAIDEAVRNAVAVGADPDKIAILDNFCWGDTDDPAVLGSLVRAAVACQETAVAYGTPFISGKDSLKNFFRKDLPDGESEKIDIPPTLLISAIGQIEDVSKAVTMDLKEPGNHVYLVGPVLTDVGLQVPPASYRFIPPPEEFPEGDWLGRLPKPDHEESIAVFRFMHELVGRGLLRSCHDLSEGGLAVAAAEMATAGGRGLELTLDEAGYPGWWFEESPSRFLVEVAPTVAEEIESLCEPLGSQVGMSAVGQVTDGNYVTIDYGEKRVIDLPLADLKAAWQAPLREL